MLLRARRIDSFSKIFGKEKNFAKDWKWVSALTRLQLIERKVEGNFNFDVIRLQICYIRFQRILHLLHSLGNKKDEGLIYSYQELVYFSGEFCTIFDLKTNLNIFMYPLGLHESYKIIIFNKIVSLRPCYMSKQDLDTIFFVKKLKTEAIKAWKENCSYSHIFGKSGIICLNFISFSRLSSL